MKLTNPLSNLIRNVAFFTEKFCKGEISPSSYLGYLRDCVRYARKGHL